MKNTIQQLERRRLFNALTSGVTLDGSIASAGEVDTHTISLNAEQMLVVALGENDGQGLDPQVELRAPGGATIRTDGGETGTFYKVIASVAGTYQLLVSDQGSNDTGNYQLTVFRPGTQGTGEEGGDVQSGRRRAGTVEAGDLDVWTISATQGQYLGAIVAENKVGDAVDIGMLIFTPDGSLVTEKTSELGVQSDILSSESQSGTYRVVIFEPGANDAGRYGISFGQFPGVQYAGDPDTLNPLLNGVARNGDAPGADFDIWPIYIGEGSTFSVTATRSTGSIDPELILFAPDSSIITKSNGSTSASLSTTATISGTHWLLLRDREADDGGRYDIEYNISIDNSNPPIKNNILTINGTGNADTIVVTEAVHSGFDTIRVSVNGIVSYFGKQEIERIEIFAGAGNDSVNFSTIAINTYAFGDVGDDTIAGGFGRDTLSGAGGKNRLFGGDGDDRLNGSGSRDYLAGENGDDRIYGNGGSDTLVGGGNVDRLFGGDSEDSLIGDSSNDKLYGDAGDDTLFGGKGSDLLDGGDGEDTRQSPDSADVIASVEK
jgi:Ca2+-binding RTX toxin-like protein